MTNLFTVRGDSIGKHNRSRYARCRCIDCGAERWALVYVGEGKPRNLRCVACAGKVKSKLMTGRKRGAENVGGVLQG